MGSRAEGPESRRPSYSVERLRAAAEARDWELLRSLCHADALLVLRMSEGQALTVDEAVETVMGPNDQKPTHLGWLLTFVDGLLYRQALSPTADEAERLYREHGVELGLR